MKLQNRKGLLYSSMMIAAMLLIVMIDNIHSIVPPANHFVSKNATVSAQTYHPVSSEGTVSKANTRSEQKVGSDQREEDKESAPVFSQSQKVEQTDRKYYEVPLSYSLQDAIYLECDSRKVPVELVLALIDVESSFNPKLISKTDDYGLMQINTCHKDSLKKSLQITDLLDEKQNIKAGVYMLSWIVNKYSDMNQALMVYNCGEYGAKKLWNKGVYSTNYSKKVIAKIQEINSKVI